MKKRKMSVPKLHKGKGVIDYGAIERGSSMGKYDIFEAGRREASKLSKQYKKHSKGKGIKWTL